MGENKMVPGAYPGEKHEIEGTKEEKTYESSVVSFGTKLRLRGFPEGQKLIDKFKTMDEDKKQEEEQGQKELQERIKKDIQKVVERLPDFLTDKLPIRTETIGRREIKTRRLILIDWKDRGEENPSLISKESLNALSELLGKGDWIQDGPRKTTIYDTGIKGVKLIIQISSYDKDADIHAYLEKGVTQ